MNGRGRRAKGSRGEYQVRDLFREMGWEADRVPSSGAAQGFKGDVRIRKNGKELTVEVKSRKDEYGRLYQILDKAKDSVFIDAPGLYVFMSYKFDSLGLESGSSYGLRIPLTTPGIKKILGMFKLVKGCDFLMVKNNNKPFIYLRYAVQG